MGKYVLRSILHTSILNQNKNVLYIYTKYIYIYLNTKPYYFYTQHFTTHKCLKSNHTTTGGHLPIRGNQTGAFILHCLQS